MVAEEKIAEVSAQEKGTTNPAESTKSPIVQIEQGEIGDLKALCKTQGLEPQFDRINESTYTGKINTPSKSREYYEVAHKPLIEEAIFSLNSALAIA